jgi:hypothetical protein
MQVCSNILNFSHLIGLIIKLPYYSDSSCRVSEQPVCAKDSSLHSRSERSFVADVSHIPIGIPILSDTSLFGVQALGSAICSCGYGDHTRWPGHEGCVISCVEARTCDSETECKARSSLSHQHSKRPARSGSGTVPPPSAGKKAVCVLNQFEAATSLCGEDRRQ